MALPRVRGVIVHTLADVLVAIRADRSAFLAATRERLGGSRATALGVYLWEYAHGVCVVCGEGTRQDAAANVSDRAEIGHLIPASFFGISGARAGFIPGNVANMCRACNRCAGDYVFSADDVIAEYVPIVWPILRKATAAHDDHAERARLARAARGLPF